MAICHERCCAHGIMSIFPAGNGRMAICHERCCAHGIMSIFPAGNGRMAILQEENNWEKTENMLYFLQAANLPGSSQRGEKRAEETANRERRPGKQAGLKREKAREAGRLSKQTARGKDKPEKRAEGSGNGRDYGIDIQ